MKNRESVIFKARSFCFMLLFIAISTSLFAQDSVKKSLKWGVEYDLMAPRIGNWNSVNLSAYIGKGHIKHSLFVAHIDINNRHLTDESFKKDNLHALGYRLELFSRNELKGWSAGLLMMYSMNEVVTTPNLQEGHFNTLFLGAPLGYTWVLWNHLTLHPNVSILVPLTNRTIQIGLDEVQQAPWGLEPGIKIGYRF